jgi:hypothetical protein
MRIDPEQLPLSQAAGPDRRNIVGRAPRAGREVVAFGPKQQQRRKDKQHQPK